VFAGNVNNVNYSVDGWSVGIGKKANAHNMFSIIPAADTI
jgi:hypothetical protein